MDKLTVYSKVKTKRGNIFSPFAHHSNATVIKRHTYSPEGTTFCLLGGELALPQDSKEEVIPRNVDLGPNFTDIRTKLVRPALLYGADTWATTRGREAQLEVNEMRMLRWMCGVTRRDETRNEHIRGTTRVVQASKTITEKRLKWYGHLRRMKEEHIVRRMLDVDIPRK